MYDSNHPSKISHLRKQYFYVASNFEFNLLGIVIILTSVDGVYTICWSSQSPIQSRQSCFVVENLFIVLFV